MLSHTVTDFLNLVVGQAYIEKHHRDTSSLEELDAWILCVNITQQT